MKPSRLSVFQAVLLSVFGAIAIISVLIFAFLTARGNANQTGRVEIWGTLDATIFQATLRGLADTETHFAAVTYIEKDPATYGKELADALSSGKGPDLFLMRQDAILIDGGKALPIPLTSLSERDFASIYADGASTFFTPEGALGAPLLIDPLILYWNKDMLAGAGYAEPPRFWDQIYDMANTITRRDQANTIEKSAIAFGEYRNVPHAKTIVSMLVMQAGGQVTAIDRTGRLAPILARGGVDRQNAQPPAESALRFYTEFSNPAKNDYSWNRSMRDAQGAFAAGDLALYIGLASEEPLLRRINPNLNFAVAQMPQVRGGDKVVDGGYVYAVVTTRTSKNQRGALTVASLLTGKSANAALSRAYGLAPARRDLLSEPFDGNLGLVKKQAIIVRSWLDPDPGKTDTIFRDMIEGVTTGALRLSEAVQRADQQMSNALGIGS